MKVSTIIMSFFINKHQNYERIYKNTFLIILSIFVDRLKSNYKRLFIII